jgi:hypothetical protein
MDSKGRNGLRRSGNGDSFGDAGTFFALSLMRSCVAIRREQQPVIPQVFLKGIAARELAAQF